MLALHGQYDAKKAELTDQAYVEKGKKADIEKRSMRKLMRRLVYYAPSATQLK